MAKFAVVGAGMLGSAGWVPRAGRGHDVRRIGTPIDAASVRAVAESGPPLRRELPIPGAVRRVPAGDAGFGPPWSESFAA